MPKKKSLPELCLHKPSGRGYVRLGVRTIYCGVYGEPACQAAYERHLAEWLAGGRAAAEAARASHTGPTVAELLARYWAWAETYYVKNGKRTSQLTLITRALVPVRRLYGDTPAKDFGPAALKACRQTMLDAGLVRTSINGHVGRIRRVWKWGVAEEIIPADVLHGLQAVTGLKRGRCAAAEAEPTRPVPAEHVDQVLPFLTAPLAAALKVQKLTGMRAGELLAMRPIDIDVTGDLWLYRPPTHKSEHWGFSRVVELGPRCQKVLAPLLLGRPVEGFLFDPRDGNADMRAKRTAARKTKTGYGNAPGTNVKANPKRKPGVRYTVVNYAQAVRRACLKAGVPAFRPHQVRHLFASEVRKKFGLEIARVLCGHKSMVATELYAEFDREKAAAAARQIG